MTPNLVYRFCEWCGKAAGGELLCNVCEKAQVWGMVSHVEEKRIPLDCAETAERGVLPEGVDAARIPIKKPDEPVGRQRESERGPLGFLRDLQQRHAAIQRVVSWPE